MAEHDRETIAGLVRSLLEDTRELIREEIALARSEIREEMTAVQTVGVAFGTAAVAALIGVTILCVALGGAVADMLNWPPWSGNAIVAVLLLAGAFFAMRYGRARLGAIRALPQTTETLKENIAWIQSKSGDK
jgi:integral membrane sensor domain MASE1